MRQAYHILAILAIAHLSVLMGLGVFMVATGRLNAEKAEKIAAVLRGDDLHATQAEAPASQPAAQPVVVRASGERIQESLACEAVIRMVDDRRQRDLADRKNLVDAAMLKFMRDREAFEKQVAEFEQARKLARQESQQTGTDREVVIISGLSPKNARDMLMKKPVPDAVRILLSMKPRTATEIIESCKSDPEKTWAVQVLQEIAGEDSLRAEQMAKAMR